MSNLPHITGPELIRALQRLGFYVVRRKGSHNFLRHAEDPTRFAIVATHKAKNRRKWRFQHIDSSLHKMENQEIK
ncbi:type II toxin-antitoxin system HicA family toxin [Moorella sp. Hama-1]|uniref:type II toxin-antitoxin system HicA family toxin n=1 Tax=Moorella sp. Hama-1 TaxID=2138101 RepID=UPI000D6453C3